jgi:hypothetical protein
MKSHLALASLLLWTPFLTGFVLLGKETAKLPASPESPSINFFWSTDGNAPQLSDKDKYKDGSYANYPDAELTPILIQEAIDQWNAVRGSYLRFALQTTTGELPLSRTDKTNNIVVKKSNSASTAAYAAPEVASGSSEITDCDIVINDIKTSVLSFMETVTHEFGHCVGLGHPHTHYGAIMSYSRGGKSYRLSADDKAGAIYLYPDPNYVTGEPNEMISCGTIRGEHRAKSSGPWLYWALSMPLIASLFMRRKAVAVVKRSK